MGKCKSKGSSGSVNDLRLTGSKRSKKREEKTSISPALREKFAWILQKTPVVVCEKIEHEKLPSLAGTTTLRVSSLKIDKLSIDTKTSPKENRKNSILSSNKNPFSKIESQNHKSQNSLTPNIIFNVSSLLSEKRSKVKKETVNLEHPPSSSKFRDYLAKSHERLGEKFCSQRSGVIPPEDGFSKILESLESLEKRNKVKLSKCAHDPNHVTPCDNVCCIEFEKKKKSNGTKCKKKDFYVKNKKFSSQMKKTEIESSDKRRESTESPCISSVKLNDSQRTINASPRRKKSKDRKSISKEEKACGERIYRYPIVQEPKKLAIFIPKKNTDRSPVSLIDQSKNQENSSNGFSMKSFWSGSRVFGQPAIKNNFSAEKFCLGQSDSTNLSFEGSSKIEIKTQNTNLLSINKKSKRGEYFPGLDVGSHPIENVNRRSQNNHGKMLEASLFPRTNTSISRNDKTHGLKITCNPASLSYISPLSYQENEMKSCKKEVSLYGNKASRETQNSDNIKSEISSLNFTNLPNAIGNQNLDNQENGVLLLKNSVNSGYSIDKEITNITENYEKDGFRHPAVKRTPENSNNLAENNLDKAANELEAGSIASTSTHNQYTNNELQLENQLPYSDYQQKETPLQNLREGSDLAFHNDFLCDSTAMNRVSDGVMHGSSSWVLPREENEPSLSDIPKKKKQIKIMKNESVPRNALQIMQRPKTMDKSIHLSWSQESGMNDQVLDNGNSVGEVPVLKINNVELLRKNDSIGSRKSLSSDYKVNSKGFDNVEFAATQENSLLNTDMILEDPEAILDLLDFDDDILKDDIVNNNEKVISQSNRHNDNSNPVEMKETRPSEILFNDTQVRERNSNEFTKAPECSETVRLFDENGHSYDIPTNFENNIHVFDEYRSMINHVNDFEESTTHIACNIEDFSGLKCTSEINEFSSNYKESGINSLNSTNEWDNQLFKKEKHRKRKWLIGNNVSNWKSESKSSSKRLKLKRRGCNQSTNEGDPFTDTSSEISSSCRSNSVYEADFNVLHNTTEIYNDKKSEISVNREISDLSHDVAQRNTEIEADDYSLVSNNKEINEPLSFTNLIAEHKDIKIVQPELKRKIVIEKPSQLEEPHFAAEPEPERGDSDTQLPHKIEKLNVTRTVYRKKRRCRNRSKFSPSYYSDSSSSSSDNEFANRKCLSSEDELETKENSSLLNNQIVRKIATLQGPPMSEINMEEVISEKDMVSQEEEDDILSLTASPLLVNMGISSRCTTPISTVSKIQIGESDKEDYFDTFINKSVKECNEDLRYFVNRKHAEKRQEMEQAKTMSKVANSENLFAIPSTPLTNVKNQTVPTLHSKENTSTINQKPFARSAVSRIFYGVCHCFFTHGRCLKTKCSYKHEIPVHLCTFQNQTEEQVFNTICGGISSKFTYYIQLVYKTALDKLNYALCLNVYTRAYTANMLNYILLDATLAELWKKSNSISRIIVDMAAPLEPYSVMVNTFFCLAQRWTPVNEYWEAMSSLTSKVRFPLDIIEKIITQCLNDPCNKIRSKQVYDYLVESDSFQLVNQEKWMSFISILYEPQEQVEDLNTVYEDNRYDLNQSIASPDGIERSPIYQTCIEPVDMDICNTPEEDTNYKLMPIDDLPTRQIFNEGDEQGLWKFYDHLQSLRKGLEHKDYEHVVGIIHQYAKEEPTPFIRSCHKIFVNEINKSKHHMEGTIKIAVQSGMHFKLREILCRLGTYVLISLADHGLWIHAYELLKLLQTYDLHYKNAGFTLLAAEICLANHRYLKALTLLKQSHILFTNSRKWKVKSERADIDLRTSVLTLLLESLCQEFAEKAFFIFDLILGEQTSNFWPVDLTRIVDKLMLSLLAQNHIDLVMNLCKKAMRYHLNFHEITYRSVITMLVSNDLMLARQFYQYATYLGVYSAVKVYPVMHVIINVDWSEEEIYLVVLEFLRKLLTDIGFAVSHLGPKQLPVFFVFEIVPERKQLYCEHSNSKSCNNEKIKNSKILLKKVLLTRFDPPIRMVKKEQGKLCKINSESLVQYLKAGHLIT